MNIKYVFVLNFIIFFLNIKIHYVKLVRYYF